jgi:hypothetical protein
MAFFCRGAAFFAGNVKKIAGSQRQKLLATSKKLQAL